MNGDEFINASNEMAKYIVNYHDNIRDRRVLSNVKPGYIRKLLPSSAPDSPDNFQDIMKDVENIIMPGVTHWQSPRFNAYFPTACSYPSLVADMLCGAIACIGFSWIASPACTELEVVMMDWLGELIGLPREFMSGEGSEGGGVIQGSASDATLVAMLSAKKKALEKMAAKRISIDRDVEKLVAYASDQAHSSVERAAMLAGVRIRLIESDKTYRISAEKLREVVMEDIESGLQPFIVVATLGTTNCCAFDNIRAIGEISTEFGIWAHVDAAYAGSALVCEEFRYLMDGMEMMDSFNFNPHKWLLINFDCSAMWVKKSRDIVNAFNVDPLYLQHEHQGKVPDYRHWQIPLGRRFRSLKIWFVLRTYGRIGLQKYIRKHIVLAKQFEKFVRSDRRFEIIGDVTMGLVCFRLKVSNSMNEELLRKINEAGVIHMVPAKIKGTYFLRFAVCSQMTESEDIEISWKEVKKQADCVINMPSNIII